MTTLCSNSKLTAQTLFLGASVVNFTTNMGWGGQPSQLTVNLIEDTSPCFSNQSTIRQSQFTSRSYADNHHHTCVDDACYIDELGRPFDSKNDPSPKERIVPGKVYYAWDNNNGFVSRYWYDQDPGFFGDKTAISVDGTYSNDQKTIDESKGFDIINTPVCFKMGDFSFAGIVRDWSRDYGSGGRNYRVSIESADSFLDQCHIILGQYGGSIFSKLSSSTYGSGSNYLGDNDAVLNYGTLKQGNLPNVFNVYGFLESMGLNYFGGSKYNDEGISAVSIIDALSVLTSARSDSPNDPAAPLNTSQKRAFSPFGRILLKTVQENTTYTRIKPAFGSYSFGVIPPSLDINGIERCHIALDLSELPRPPMDYRISETVMSIMNLIRRITDDTGYDFYFDMIPATYLSQPYTILKVRTVSRAKQPIPNQVVNTIEEFKKNNMPISASNIGKEKNETAPRAMYFGPQQQRLYQAKNYRLAYNQTSYVYHPVLQTFVNFFQHEGQANLGKMRLPTSLSTRNPALSTKINGEDITALFNNDEDIKNTLELNRFEDIDDIWNDKEITDNKTNNNVLSGNYGPAKAVTNSRDTTARFFPLYKDVICPFFGFQMEETLTVDTNPDNNTYRLVRPVFLDTWTGQLVVSINIADLPKISVSLNPFNQDKYFLLFETEMRAAIAGFDNFLLYCLGKIFKPGIFLMLVEAYSNLGISLGISNFDSCWDNSPANIAARSTTGHPSGFVAQNTSTNINGDFFINPNFLKDLEIIHSYIQKIANKYYGRKYMVKVPELVSYRDTQYSDIQIPAGSDTISVFQGSGKIYYNYEPADDGAWEEYGNIIDDSIFVGSPYYYVLADDNGKIPPLLGYNASDSFDYVSRAMCGLDILNKAIYVDPAATNYYNSLSEEQKAGYQWKKDYIKTNYDYLFQANLSGACDDSKFIFPSLDVTALSEGSYVVTPCANPVKSAFNRNNIPLSASKKLYCKTNVEDKIIFLSPKTLQEPRIIIDSPGIPLTTTSYSYETDPNITIIANVALEDLLIYLKKIPVGSEDPNFVGYMMSFISPMIGNNALLLGNNMGNNSPKYMTIAPKMAHPFFAGIPIKSNQFCYGPWTNYPNLIASDIFPDASNPNEAIENLIGGVKIDQNQDFAPWNYGGMSFLDQRVISEIQNNVNYQQVLETAQIDMPGLPIFGLGSRFTYFTPSVQGNNQIKFNNQLYDVEIDTLNYTDVKYNTSNSNPVPNAPLAGQVLVGFDYSNSSTTSSPITYETIKLSSINPNPIAPLISSIQVSVGGSITTTYGFRTYIRKLGFFNKETGDRLKQNALMGIKRNKQFASMSGSIISRVNNEKQRRLNDIGDNRKLGAREVTSKFYATSPVEVMCGLARPFLPNDKLFNVKRLSYLRQNLENLENTEENTNNDQLKKQIQEKIKQLEEEINNIMSLPYGRDLGDDSSKNGSITGDSNGINQNKKNLRYNTFVGIYPTKEIAVEMNAEYANKSLMSLDGLFSPVSFYPTLFNTTYPLVPYTSSSCPYCKGTKSISDTYVNKQGQNATGTFYCSYCANKRKTISYSSKTTKTSSSIETLPPYIITDTNDIDTLINFNTAISSSSSTSAASSSDSSSSSEEIPVNLYSLQPIVVPYGEFRNPNVQNNGTYVDRCRHSIRVVAKGTVAPKKNQSLDISQNLLKYIDPATNKEQTERGLGFNADYYQKDILNKDNPQFLNNQRFLGLRGPIMLHGWGYDKEGYPIPNAADEPKEVDEFGNPKRFKLTRSVSTSSTKYSKLKNGDLFVLNKTDTIDLIKSPSLLLDDFTSIADDRDVLKVEYTNDLSDETGGFLQGQNSILGDIIGKTQEFKEGKWTSKKKLKQFYLNWAERPDLWPVGPIDLRWDEEKRVWSTTSDQASIYKMVYVVLEEDLVKEYNYDETYVARGFLDDLEYSSEPLPNGQRRLVYVKDRAGYTAPRGCKLLCRYDTDTGFYEPITKPSFICKGIIDNGNKAVIQMAYAAGKKAGEIPTMLVSFSNPFNYTVVKDKKGMFTFMDGNWTITAVEQ